MTTKKNTITGTVPAWTTTHDAAIDTLRSAMTAQGKILPSLAAHVLAVATSADASAAIENKEHAAWSGFGDYLTGPRASALRSAVKALVALPATRRNLPNASALVANGAGLGSKAERDKGKALKITAGTAAPQGRKAGTPNAVTAGEKGTGKPDTGTVTTRNMTPADLSDDDVARLMADLAVEALRRGLAIPAGTAAIFGALKVGPAVSAGK